MNEHPKGCSLPLYGSRFVDIFFSLVTFTGGVSVRVGDILVGWGWRHFRGLGLETLQRDGVGDILAGWSWRHFSRMGLGTFQRDEVGDTSAG